MIFEDLNKKKVKFILLRIQSKRCFKIRRNSLQAKGFDFVRVQGQQLLKYLNLTHRFRICI